MHPSSMGYTGGASANQRAWAAHSSGNELQFDELQKSHEQYFPLLRKLLRKLRRVYRRLHSQN